MLSRSADELSPEMFARVLNNRGNCLSNMGDDIKALTNYEFARRIDHKYDYPMVNAAGIFLKRGEFERALSECEKAIEINPKYTLSHTNKADALHHLGRYMETVEACTTAIELDPSNYHAYRRRGEAYAALGDRAKAQADYLKSESLKIA